MSHFGMTAAEEYERRLADFKWRWGFDPTASLRTAIDNGDYTLEGGTENERAFIREVLAEQPMTDDEARRMAVYGPCETCGAARDVRIRGRADLLPSGLYFHALYCPGCGEP
jgi:hypothetical protein